MDKKEFIGICNSKLKAIRREYGFTQEKMAQILGFSKKTIVEIEKSRSSLGWTGSVSLCGVFRNIEIIAAAFGGRPTDIILALAFEGNEPEYPHTMGGKVWWKDLEVRNGYKIQQNILSRHYRILNPINQRICSSFDWEDIYWRYCKCAGAEDQAE